MKASSEYKCIQKNSNEYLNDNENDNDNDNDIDNDNMNDNVNVNDACGAKKENKRIYYCREKESPFYDSAPTIDTELMKQRVLERYRNMMNQS